MGKKRNDITVKAPDGSERVVPATWFKGSPPATEPQLRYIRLLARGLGRRPPQAQTRHQATLVIRSLKGAKRRARSRRRKARITGSGR